MAESKNKLSEKNKLFAKNIRMYQDSLKQICEPKGPTPGAPESLSASVAYDNDKNKLIFGLVQEIIGTDKEAEYKNVPGCLEFFTTGGLSFPSHISGAYMVVALASAEIVVGKLNLDAPYKGVVLAQRYSHELVLLDFCRNRPIPVDEISFDNPFDNSILSDFELRERLNGFAGATVFRQSISQQVEKIAAWETKISDWEQKLGEQTGEVHEIETRLAKIKTTYNFVGLNKGFKQIYTTKLWESGRAFALMLLLVGCMVAILWKGHGVIMTLPASVTATATDPQTIPLKNYLLLIPFLGAELLVLYFFRIALKSYFAAKAQQLQIQLRMTLLTFIEEYLKFKTGNENQALEKFESLIFSGISADTSNIPTQFDGIEGLAKLLGALKGK